MNTALVTSLSFYYYSPRLDIHFAIINSSYFIQRCFLNCIVYTVSKGGWVLSGKLRKMMRWHIVASTWRNSVKSQTTSFKIAEPHLTFYRVVVIIFTNLLRRSITVHYAQELTLWFVWSSKYKTTGFFNGDMAFFPNKKETGLQIHADMMLVPISSSYDF